MLFHRRVIKGLLVAAIMPLAVISVVFAGCVGMKSNIQFLAAGALMIMTSAGKGLAIMMATLLITMAGYCVATWLRRFSFLFYVIGGTAIALLVTAVVARDLTAISDGNDIVELAKLLTLATSLVTGPLAAAAFWAIARPDRINRGA
jgi:hypothetical protein